MRTRRQGYISFIPSVLAAASLLLPASVFAGSAGPAAAGASDNGPARAENTGGGPGTVYAKKIVRTFTWGSGPDQLGSNWRKYTDGFGNYIGPEDAWSEATGPGRIFVDYSGRVLIWDNFNNRMFVYDPSKDSMQATDRQVMSDYMDFDSSGRIYLVSTGVLPGGIFVYGSNFEHLASYHYNNLDFKPDLFKEIRAGDGKTVTLVWFDTIAKVDLTKPASPVKIGKITRQVLPVVFEQESVWKRRDDGVEMVTPRTSRKVDIRYEFHGRYGYAQGLVGEDDTGRIYLLMGIQERMPQQKSTMYVHIYSADGSFIDEVQQEPDDRLFFSQGSDALHVGVDLRGTIYQLNIRRDGARLISWTRTDGG